MAECIKRWQRNRHIANLAATVALCVLVLVPFVVDDDACDDDDGNDDDCDDDSGDHDVLLSC